MGIRIRIKDGVAQSFLGHAIRLAATTTTKFQEEVTTTSMANA